MPETSHNHCALELWLNIDRFTRDLAIDLVANSAQQFSVNISQCALSIIYLFNKLLRVHR